MLGPPIRVAGRRGCGMTFHHLAVRGVSGGRHRSLPSSCTDRRLAAERVCYLVPWSSQMSATTTFFGTRRLPLTGPRTRIADPVVACVPAGTRGGRMHARLFVGHLSWNTSDSDLSALFAAHAEVVNATVISDRDTGRSRGFGFDRGHGERGRRHSHLGRPGDQRTGHAGQCGAGNAAARPRRLHQQRVPRALRKAAKPQNDTPG